MTQLYWKRQRWKHNKHMKTETAFTSQRLFRKYSTPSRCMLPCPVKKKNKDELEAKTPGDLLQSIVADTESSS